MVLASRVWPQSQLAPVAFPRTCVHSNGRAQRQGAAMVGVLQDQIVQLEAELAQQRAELLVRHAAFREIVADCIVAILLFRALLLDRHPLEREHGGIGTPDDGPGGCAEGAECCA